MAIPKLIHQTTPDKEHLAPAVRANIDHLRALNPGWDHRLYDDADIAAFLSRHFGPDTLACYDRINPAYGPARADFFRYHLMLVEGGVYLDIKSTLTKSLDQVLLADESYILARWPNARGEAFEGWGIFPELSGLAGGEYQNWHVIAEPGHPFLAAVIARVRANIDDYTPARYGVGKIGVLRTTGPIAYTLAIEKIRAGSRHRVVDMDAFGLRYSIFGTDGRSWTAHQVLFKNHYQLLDEPVVCGKMPYESGATDPFGGRIGRNQPCPCGSGRRFKHCHGSLVA